MKRFLVFAGENYYPRAAVDNLIGQHDKIIMALGEAANCGQEWAQVLDTETGQMHRYERDADENWVVEVEAVP